MDLAWRETTVWTGRAGDFRKLGREQDGECRRVSEKVGFRGVRKWLGVGIEMGGQ